MQALYRDGMAAVVPNGKVSLSNSAVNPDYLHNRKLTAAADFWDHRDLPNYCTLVNTPDRTVVAVSTNPRTIINSWTANNVWKLCSLGASDLMRALLAPGICEDVPNVSSPVLIPAVLAHHFRDVCIVLVQAAAREVSNDVNFACTCLLGSLHNDCSTWLSFVQLPWLSMSPDVVLHPYASRTEASRTIRGKEGQTAGTARQQDRTEAKQALLSEFFPQRVQQNFTQDRTAAGSPINCFFTTLF